jgi:type III pantothenate kinase
MNDLVIDVGNSFTKAGIFRGDVLERTFVTDEITPQWLESLTSKHTISRGILSNVGAELGFLGSFLKTLPFALELKADTPVPVRNNYKTPETLGKDRLAGAVGAQFMYPGENVLVIDAGSCITYDLVNGGAEYLGGAISPGLKMRFKALHEFTGRLPLVEQPDEIKFTGRTTSESMVSGVVNGMLKEIEGFIAEYASQYSGLRTVLCGGDANYLAKQLKKNIFVHQNLILTGLHQILKHNAR